MIYYGVASYFVSEVMGFFPTREEAEAIVQQVIDEAPELAGDVFVAEIQFEEPSAN